MYKRGLAYRRKSTVNWCESCQTVLANEQVVDGGCWRCGTMVTTRELEQWFFRITAYTDELLEGLGRLSTWPDKVLTMQRNWIGRSEGARLRFPIVEADETSGARAVDVFTTRVDTVFGATFVTLGPEHPLVEAFALESADPQTMRAQANRFRAQDRIGRISGAIEKEGFFTGRFAINPFTEERVPIWVANFVVGDYGTGAVMAVPAHDQRDFEFARKYDLPVRMAVAPADAPRGAPADAPAGPFTDYGVLVGSGEYDGLTSEEAQVRLADAAQKRGLGERTVQYRLKDWGISRQRYWGTPIPMVYCERDGIVPVPDDQLPVLLPPIWSRRARSSAIS